MNLRYPFLVLGCFLACGHVRAADTSTVSAPARFASLQEYAVAWAPRPDVFDHFFHGQVSRAISYPKEKTVPDVLKQLDAYIAEVETPPIGVNLPPQMQADRLRWGAFLRVAKARLLFEMQQNRLDLDLATQRRDLAKAAIDECDKALALIAEIKKNTPPKIITDWLGEEAIEDNLLCVKAHAHAMLWSLGVDRARNKEAALAAWHRLSAGYLDVYPAAAEMEKILMPYLKDPSVVPHITWIGVGMLTLGLVMAWFTSRNPNPLQIWVMRTFICVGAGMAASGIHGSLELTYNGWITAGGAMAVVVLFYRFKPAPLDPAPIAHENNHPAADLGPARVGPDQGQRQPGQDQ